MRCAAAPGWRLVTDELPTADACRLSGGIRQGLSAAAADILEHQCSLVRYFCDIDLSSDETTKAGVQRMLEDYQRHQAADYRPPLRPEYAHLLGKAMVFRSRGRRSGGPDLYAEGMYITHVARFLNKNVYWGEMGDPVRELMLSHMAQELPSTLLQNQMQQLAVEDLVPENVARLEEISARINALVHGNISIWVPSDVLTAANVSVGGWAGCCLLCAVNAKEVPC